MHIYMHLAGKRSVGRTRAYKYNNYVPGAQKVIIKTLTMTIPGASGTVVQINGYPCGTGTRSKHPGCPGRFQDSW